MTPSDGVVVGKADAKVPVDVYEDMLCPFCKQFEQSGGPVVTEFVDAGRVKAKYRIVAFLDRSSTTQYSTRAANATYCAADAGVFPAYHQSLYAHQPAEGSAGLSDDQLIAFGREAKATGDAFAQCVRTRKYADFVTRITEQASRDGIVGTPTIFVNGSPLQAQPPDASAVRTAITAALGS